MDVTGAMSAYLRAVPWFAETEPWGGEAGGEVVVEGRGEIRTVPNGAKAEGVSGMASMVMVDEGAIVEGLWGGVVVGRCTLVVWWVVLDTEDAKSGNFTGTQSEKVYDVQIGTTF